MKNLKMFPTAIVLCVISIFAGCSDQLNSPGDSESFRLTGNHGKEVIPTVEESFSPDKYFRIQIKLKPHRVYRFNALNTGFDEINSIDVENLLPEASSEYPTECQDILIYGSTTDGDALDCHSKGFNLKEVIVENTGSKILDLDVSLEGVKKKYEFPVDSE